MGPISSSSIPLASKPVSAPDFRLALCIGHGLSGRMAEVAEPQLRARLAIQTADAFYMDLRELLGSEAWTKAEVQTKSEMRDMMTRLIPALANRDDFRHEPRYVVKNISDALEILGFESGAALGLLTPQAQVWASEVTAGDEMSSVAGLSMPEQLAIRNGTTNFPVAPEIQSDIGAEVESGIGSQDQAGEVARNAMLVKSCEALTTRSLTLRAFDVRPGQVDPLQENSVALSVLHARLRSCKSADLASNILTIGYLASKLQSLEVLQAVMPEWIREGIARPDFDFAANRPFLEEALTEMGFSEDHASAILSPSPSVPQAAGPSSPSLAATQTIQPPARGSLVYIKQIHAPNGNLNVAPELQDMVLRSQRRVLDALLEDHPSTVFVEGLVGVHQNPFSAVVVARNRELVIGWFGKYQKGHFELDPSQRKLLYALGAPVIYACLNPDVELRGTATAKNDARVAQLNSELVALHAKGESERVRQMVSSNREFSLNEREEDAVSLIEAWREQNPTRNAALVFGQTHNFAQYEARFKSTFSEISTSG